MSSRKRHQRGSSRAAGVVVVLVLLAAFSSIGFVLSSGGLDPSSHARGKFIASRKQAETEWNMYLANLWATQKSPEYVVSECPPIAEYAPPCSSVIAPPIPSEFDPPELLEGIPPQHISIITDTWPEKFTQPIVPHYDALGRVASDARAPSVWSVYVPPGHAQRALRCGVLWLAMNKLYTAPPRVAASVVADVEAAAAALRTAAAAHPGTLAALVPFLLRRQDRWLEALAKHSTLAAELVALRKAAVGVAPRASNGSIGGGGAGGGAGELLTHGAGLLPDEPALHALASGVTVALRRMAGAGVGAGLGPAPAGVPPSSHSPVVADQSSPTTSAPTAPSSSNEAQAAPLSSSSSSLAATARGGAASGAAPVWTFDDVRAVQTEVCRPMSRTHPPGYTRRARVNVGYGHDAPPPVGWEVGSLTRVFERWVAMATATGGRPRRTGSSASSTSGTDGTRRGGAWAEDGGVGAGGAAGGGGAAGHLGARLGAAHGGDVVARDRKGNRTLTTGGGGEDVGVGGGAARQRCMHPLLAGLYAYAAIIHTHAFTDCNTRTASAVASAILMEGGLPPMLILRSDVFKKLPPLRQAAFLGDTNGLFEVLGKEVAASGRLIAATYAAMSPRDWIALLGKGEADAMGDEVDVSELISDVLGTA